MVKSNNTEALIIFIISFGFSIASNLANIYVSHLMYGASDGVLYGSTIYSPDNAWYLNQIKNYLDGLGFTIDPLDPIYAVRRTPGYPLFYGVHYVLLGESGAHNLIPYTQTFLHALAAVALFKTAKMIFPCQRAAFWVGILYGLSPFVVSFLFLTITESLFPSVIVFSMYFSVSAYYKNSLLSALYAGALLAVAVLISPRNILLSVFIFSLLFYFGSIRKQLALKINLVFICAFIIMMTPWAIRNYLVFDEFVPLEVYHLNHAMEDQNIKNIALYRWWSTWGSPEGVRLHREISVDIYSDNPYKSIDTFINNEVPLWVYNVESKSYLRALLIDYQKCMLRGIELNGGRRLRYPEKPDLCEYQVSDGLNSFAEKIKIQYPINAFIVSPLYIRGMQYIFHSAIHTWRSFDDYRSHYIKIVLKGIAYMINILLWLFSTAYLVTKRSFSQKILLGIVPVASFVFLVYYRHVEGRYLLQVYPWLYLMSTAFVVETLIPVLKKIWVRHDNV